MNATPPPPLRRQYIDDAVVAQFTAALGGPGAVVTDTGPDDRPVLVDTTSHPAKPSHWLRRGRRGHDRPRLAGYKVAAESEAVNLFACVAW